MELSSRTTNFEAHGQLAIIADNNTRNDEDDDKEESIDEASVIVA